MTISKADHLKVAGIPLTHTPLLRWLLYCQVPLRLASFAAVSAQP
jgi:hypothetical protein